jgi:TetR/AcrR family transcriptional repressor of nem operon
VTAIDTRTAILDAAQGLIQTLGANGISYQHISDAVKIRKASIHYHFPTKEKLVEALIHRYHAAFLATVDEIVDSKASAPEKLAGYIGLFDTTLRDGKRGKVCLCGMLGAELASLGSPAAADVRRFYRENAKRLVAILDEGRRAGAFTFPGDTRATAMLAFSLLEGAMLVVRADGGVAQFRAITAQLRKLLGA